MFGSSRRRVLVLACLIAGSALTGTAHAGVPYVLGNTTGTSYPSVTGSPDGTAFHVVWNDPGANVYRYCKVLPTSPGCAVSAVIPNANTVNDSPADAEQAWIIEDPNGGPLHLIMPNYIGSTIYESVSLDEGATFSAPSLVHKSSGDTLGVGSGRPVFESDGQTALVPRGFNGGLQVADTSGNNKTLRLGNDGQAPVSGYDVNVAKVSGGMLGTLDDLENTFVHAAADGNSLTGAGAWSRSTFVAKGMDSTMDGNGQDAFLASTVEPTDALSDQLEIRQWGGMGFGAPKIVEKTHGYIADVAVSGNGFAGVAYRKNGTGLRYAEINTNGKYVPKTIATTDEIFFDLNVAHNDDGKGLVVWRRDDAIGAADLTEVKDPSAPQLSKSKTKHGLTLGLNVPGSCVVPGKKFSATTGGQGVGKLDKVVYKVAGSPSETDTKNPWGVKLTTPAGAAAGARLPVTATMYVERKKAPKKFHFTIDSYVDVCGG